MKWFPMVIGLLVAAPRFAVAQFPSEVQPGTRVRVWLPETPRQREGPNRRQLLRGTVESVDGSLRLRVPGTTGSLAAIMNAVADAIPGGAGAALDMPATPAKVWAACRKSAEA